MYSYFVFSPDFASFLLLPLLFQALTFLTASLLTRAGDVKFQFCLIVVFVSKGVVQVSRAGRPVGSLMRDQWTKEALAW